IDNHGYDCSGFVWRVFHETGIEFKRATARTLWAAFPEATEKERVQFGTLVFFNRLKHVGIVRDAYSFYHASRSQGVVRSNFTSYWKKRIVGYRSALALTGTQDKWMVRENKQGDWKGRGSVKQMQVKQMQNVIQRSAKLWQTIVLENGHGGWKERETL